MRRADPRDWVERWVRQADNASDSYGGDPYVGGWFHLLAFVGCAWYLLLCELVCIVWED